MGVRAKNILKFVDRIFTMKKMYDIMEVPNKLNNLMRCVVG